MKVDLRKIYHFTPIDRPADGSIPTGGDIYVECNTCHDILSTVSFLASACSCGNLSGGDGKISIQSPDQTTPLRGKLR
jgi:hypothetical protein